MKFSKYFDHTILSPDATIEQVKRVCQEAVEYDFASVCVNSYYTKTVSECLNGSDVKTCVVVGFPLGAMASGAKAYETTDAVLKGADEIDMVINVGALKSGDYNTVFLDIMAVRTACEGKVLKVIIETCLLNSEEIIKACDLAVKAGADYVKTSTGFSTGGADVRDVEIMKKTVGKMAKVKASGGIRDYYTAKSMIEAGADRLGTSKTIEIMNEYNM